MAEVSNDLGGNDLFEISARSSSLWGANACAPPEISLFGLQVANVTLKQAVADIVEAAAAGRRQRIAFANAHVINHAAMSPLYARVLAGADKVYPDGSGMAIAARWSGSPLADNVNGTDMFPLLCAASASAGQKLFLLGGRPGVTEAAAQTVAARGWGDVIAGTHHGYVKRGGKEEAEAIEKINSSGASIVLVGMGVPIQDVWIKRNAGKLDAPVVMGVGGLFDFFSGQVSRAPAFLRERGLEWTWRLAQEPGRLWKRYVLGNVIFLALAALNAADARMRRQMPAATSSRPGKIAASVHAAFRSQVVSGLPAGIKRLIDIAGSLSAFAVFLPAIAAIAIAIPLESRGPVLFRQRRIGQNGRPFTMIKFRSMRADAELSYADLKGEVVERRQIRFKAKLDPRVTRVGRFIRRTSLDELPQLWNVLRGEMSLVGPRPALPSEVEQYGQEDRDRLIAKPGITCTWQVSGRADIDFVGQVELDRDYVRNQSVFMDLKLILRTVKTILAGKGAY